MIRDVDDVCPGMDVRVSELLAPLAPLVARPCLPLPAPARLCPPLPALRWPAQGGRSLSAAGAGPHYGAGAGVMASTRSGLPEPPTILSGAAITTAPVGGSWSRLTRLVMPNFPWPCMVV
jgi:hypothetical protein